MAMTPIYGLAIIVGALGALFAIGFTMNPDRPALSPPMRNAVQAVLGFGLAGMSASFGGWPSGLAFVAAVGGALVLVFVGMRYGDWPE